jgi:O-antigen ligase
MNALEQSARPAWETWTGGLSVGLLTLALYLADRWPVDATVSFVILTGIATAAALPAAWRGVAAASVLETLRRLWPFVVYGGGLAIVWAATPVPAATAEVQRQALFLLLIAATASAAAGRAGRLLVLVQLGGLLLVLLQIPGPRSGFDHLGRAAFYHALTQWSGYPELGLLMAAAASGSVAIALASQGVAARLAACALGASFAGATVFLQSRSAVLTVGVVAAWLTLVALVKWRGRLALAVVLLGVAAGVWLLAAGPDVGSTFERAASAVARETAIRQAGWDAALAMARDHPLTGVGLGGYSAEYALRYTAWDATHAYNIVLHVLAESGVIGLLGWAVLWGRVLWRGLRHASRTATGIAIFAVHGMLVAFLVRSQSEHFLANLDTSLRTLLLVSLWIGLSEGLAATSARSRA